MGGGDCLFCHSAIAAKLKNMEFRMKAILRAWRDSAMVPAQETVSHYPTGRSEVNAQGKRTPIIAKRITFTPARERSFGERVRFVLGQGQTPP